MSGRDASCDERIASELEDSEQRFARVWQQLDSELPRTDTEDCDLLFEELAPLSVEVKTVLKVMFSWGGPSDWLEIVVSTDSRIPDIERVVYHFADWFDHAEREVSADAYPAVWRAAEYYVEEAAGLLPRSSAGDWT